ncbi:LysR family transcriptional regulator [Idiomarina loihiensis]|uniref:Transcriptional regulator, LysR family n=1 Tax=Idiomarina loihiensis (strain ATCC BAA-735 / DSM 15497 / L2-TR) TaxID=283942 RepID=Q5QV68_IDILO|nr:LysR family transcriptional regulator [Idiomarina loihiensis]AAV83323.1 Transcriptional regulator, LysR family [Idiomarina loihiensis L2TR]AGM37366.1 LysR family transcriptional regulator [Idiomarina loihiensis GSL 199]
MNPKMIRSLKAFTRTVELNSMSAAANELHMTVSAISQQLQRLENDNGISLFHRNTRSLSLTEAGQVFYQSCLDMLAIAAKNQERWDQLTNQPQGQIKIIAPVGFGGGLLSEPLKQLQHEFANVSFQLHMTDEPIDLITAGADLAIRIGPLADSTLYARHLADWHMVPCIAAEHPAAENSIKSFDDLPEGCFIGHIPSLPNKDFPKPKVLLNNMQTVVQLTLDGVGYALLPQPEIKHYIESGRLLRLLPEWEGSPYSVHAVLPIKDNIPAKTERTIEVLSHFFHRL